MSTLNQLQEVEIDDIFISTTNPRKTFDESSMKELQESISKVGVLQPILLRPIEDHETFELVCGERRFRAAVNAGLKTIPANIRHLTDEEAFEMQIIENLERKDVHPLEEADAFKKMLESGRYKIADIAAKFARPESFITQRLKLTELIDEIKKDFYDEKLGIGQAIMIARISEDSQREIYQRSQETWDPGYGTIDSLRRDIERKTYDLNEAPFDLTDENLIKTAPACITCPKRAGANPSLFSDIEEPNTCFDFSCYRNKKEAHISHNIMKIVEGEKDALIGRGYNNPEGFIQDLLKQNNITPLERYRDFREIQSHELEHYPDAIDIFMAAGSEAGTYLKGVIRDTAKQKTNEADSPEQQIQKIESRESRAKELDRIKIFQAIKETDAFETYVTNDKPLNSIEKKAMWFIFKKTALEYSSVNEYNKEIGCPDNYNDVEEYKFYENANSKTDDLKTTKLVRMAIIDFLTGMHEPDIERDTRSRFFYEIFKLHHPDVLSGIEEVQNAIAEDRIQRVAERIEKLKQ